MRKREPELVANLTSNPLPDAFEVKTREGEDVKAISSDAAARRRCPAGVDKITRRRGGRRTASCRSRRLISTAFAIATLILLLSSALLIANTIRLSIFSRRREIEVMKLVGATNWFVRGPFMLEGLICGVGGSVLAILLLLFAKAIRLSASWPGASRAAPTCEALAFTWIAVAILLVGLTVGALGLRAHAPPLPERLAPWPPGGAPGPPEAAEPRAAPASPAGRLPASDSIPR